jgi:hypothetical protein
LRTAKGSRIHSVRKRLDKDQPHGRMRIHGSP